MPPPPAKPSGALFLILGSVGLLFFTIMWLQQAHAGFGTAFGVGLFVAGAGALLTIGIGRAAKKALPLAAMAGVPAAVLLLCVGVGPTASTAFCESDEEDRWGELTLASEQAGFDPARWPEGH